MRLPMWPMQHHALQSMSMSMSNSRWPTFRGITTRCPDGPASHEVAHHHNGRYRSPGTRRLCRQLSGHASDGDESGRTALVDRRESWSRPVGVAIAADGALLVADDVGDVVWRVTWGEIGADR